MIVLALLALLQQDTNTVISPRVRTMLERFPPPSNGAPSITTRFSADTAWVGQQVELVTATWFPRRLRDQLRRSPQIRSPSLSGLWSARSQLLPIPAGSRTVGSQLYDLYVTYQVIFPLGPGQIVAPAAALTFGVPVSTSYFAPEEKKTYLSAPVSLVVRPVPRALGSALAGGPTAREMHIAWRAPAGGLHAGAPTFVELDVTGQGNLTLWPAPNIAWPPFVHVYPEPTEEHIAPGLGLIVGEKRFRYTVVPDSAGVLTLPAVTYPYFDATDVNVQTATARAVALAVLEPQLDEATRHPLPVGTVVRDGLVETLVDRWWWALVLVGLLPGLALAGQWRARTPRPAPASHGTDPELALRRAVGSPVEAGSDHVIAALRLRGVGRDDAEQIRGWLAAAEQHRYGPAPGTAPAPPDAVHRALHRLKYVLPLLLLMAGVVHAAEDSGVDRYHSGDYAGAARAFSAAAKAHPTAPLVWHNLGAAEWMRERDPAAAAAWLRGLALAPRDATLRQDWSELTNVPYDVRGLRPTVPVSRAEWWLIAWVGWLLLWAAVWARRRTAMVFAAAVMMAALVLALARSWAERPGHALIAVPVAMRISPHPAMMSLADLAPWTQVQVLRADHGWYLVSALTEGLGAAPGITMSGWVPQAAIAPIGPLD